MKPEHQKLPETLSKDVDAIDIPIPEGLTKLLKMVVEKAYNDGYEQGYSDGKYGG